MPRYIDSIIIHHSVSPRSQTLEKSILSFDRTHRIRLHPIKNKLGYHIAYHYVIAENGAVKQTRADDEIGWHASNLAVNKKSIGICLIGNFDVEHPSPRQLWALRDVIKAIKARFYIKEVSGHRKYASKSCPGKNFPDKFIKDAFHPKR